MSWLIVGGWSKQIRWLGKSRLGESGGQPFWEFGGRWEAYRFDDYDRARKIADGIPGSSVVPDDVELELRQMPDGPQVFARSASSDWDHARRT